jgi:O-antigen/teichoic acid export membrane protein
VGGGTGICVSFVTIGVGLISVPLTVQYLGAEQYGIWITISSFLAWLYVSDMGFGSALTNALATASGLEDVNLAKSLVATAFWTLILISIFIFILLLSLIPQINWEKLLNVSTKVSLKELKTAIFFTIFFFCLSFPASISISIYRGYQETHKGNLWSISGSVFSLISLLLVVRIEGGLVLLVIAMIGSNTFVKVVNIIYLFFFDKPEICPCPRAIRRTCFKQMWNIGIYYLIQQLGNIGMFHIQPIILTQIKGPFVVGPFNIAYRLLTLPHQMLILLLSPLIGAYGEARARGELKWIRNTLIYTTAASTVMMVLLLIPLYLISPWIITLWAGPEMVPDMKTLKWLSFYAISTGLATPLAIFLQGLQEAKAIAILTILNGMFTIFSSIYLVKTFGTQGMAMSMSMALTLITIPICLIYSVKGIINLVKE